jgi:NitT/TauT family transport system permease protein
MLIGGHRVPMMASLLLWAALWEIVGQLDVTILLPPLSRVFVRMAEIVPTPTFLSALWVTAYAFVIGNVIAIGIGVPLGVLMGRSAIADRIFLPWVNLFLSAPLTALVPVIMVLFGLGQTTIILTVTLFAIWIIVLDARAGVRSISPSLVEMAESFGATPWQAFSRIYVWAALPEILAGVRLGMIRAVKGVIIGQLLVSIVGFGALFKLYGSRFLMEHFWAALLVLFAFAFLMAEGLAWLERRVDYYAASRG